MPVRTGALHQPRLSALVVARNEAHQLADCLERLRFADEIVVVLDRSTDASEAIARRFTDKVLVGAWPIEGARRNTGIDACTGEWILEVDADERVPEALAREIRETIRAAAPGHFLVPFRNYVGGRWVRYGWGASWGVNAAPRLFSRGAKRWGMQRVHPALALQGPPRRLDNAIEHHTDRGLNDMLDRLKRYTDARAADLRASARPLPPMIVTLRRGATRFLKCYVRRRGYREGALGFAIALMAALYPVIAHLKAAVDEPEPDD